MIKNFGKIICVVMGLGLTSLTSCKNDQKTISETPVAAVNNALQSESVTRGKKIYNSLCLQCHLPTGGGSEMIPPLKGSNWLTEKREATIAAVKYGLKGKIEVNGKSYTGFMPKQNLKDEQVADVLNYIMNSWGNTSVEEVTPAEVKAVEKK